MEIDPHNYGGDIDDFFKRLIIGIEVTHDGKYTYFNYHKHWTSPEHDNVLGRINLETGKLEYADAVNLGVKDENGCYIQNCNHINHIIINPMRPNLILFNHPSVVPFNSVDKFNIIDLKTGKIMNYKPRKSLWDGSVALVFHMIWSYDGEYVVFTEGVRNNYAAYIKADLIEQYNTGKADSLTAVSRPVGYSACGHFMLEDTLTWGMGDREEEGVAIFKMLDMEQYKDKTFIDTEYNNHVAYTDEVYNAELYVIRWELQEDMKKHGLGDMVNVHPYNPHPEISADGKLCSWGDVNRETGVLGVAWMENPFCADK